MCCTNEDGDLMCLWCCWKKKDNDKVEKEVEEEDSVWVVVGDYVSSWSSGNQKNKNEIEINDEFVLRDKISSWFLPTIVNTKHDYLKTYEEDIDDDDYDDHDDHDDHDVDVVSATSSLSELLCSD